MNLTRSTRDPHDDLSLLTIYLRRTYGLDLSPYKEAFVRRRLVARLRARGVTTYREYLRVLMQDPEEYAHLLATFTVGYTYFFRDPSTFRALRDEVLVPLLAERERTGTRRLTLWSAGCATGEEPYSLAILIAQLLGPRLSRWRVRILATDIDKEALARARQAVYGPRSFHGTQWPDIDRFFTATPDGRALVPPVRDLVTFREHNLLARPPGETFDIVFARHVLMYLQRPQQVRVGRHLAQTLRPGGTLVLGRLETLPPPLTDTFEVLNIRERIYRKRGGDPC